MRSMARQWLLAALSLAAIACGGTTTHHDDPTQPTPYCSVAFSGGITGTYDCHVVLHQVNGAWQLTLNTVGAGAPIFSVTVSWPSVPALYTAYTLQNPGTMTSAAATAQPAAPATAVWVAGPEATTGAVSMTVTSLYASVTGGPCGDLTATLVPDGRSTASGEVQVTASF